MKQPLPRPSIYLITERHAFRDRPDTPAETLWQAQLTAIHLAAQAGCPFIQIREKDLPARRLAEFVRIALTLAHPFGTRVLVNDRLDVALAAGADGVHLRVNSLPIAAVRAQAQRHGLSDFLIAASTHSLAEAETAVRAGADFIVCGPVYATPSKLAYGPPLGLARLAEICRQVRLPVFALGGITLENFREPLQQGAAGIAAIRLFTDLNRLTERIRLMLT
jgi:thiamine-phosphate pyrophosphorylase